MIKPNLYYRTERYRVMPRLAGTPNFSPSRSIKSSSLPHPKTRLTARTARRMSKSHQPWDIRKGVVQRTQLIVTHKQAGIAKTLTWKFILFINGRPRRSGHSGPKIAKTYSPTALYVEASIYRTSWTSRGTTSYIDLCECGGGGSTLAKAAGDLRGCFILCRFDERQMEPLLYAPFPTLSF